MRSSASLVTPMNLHFEQAGAGVPVVLTTGLGHSSEVWSICSSYCGGVRAS